MKILLDFQKGMRAVTLNSVFSLCGLKAVCEIKLSSQETYAEVQGSRSHDQV